MNTMMSPANTNGLNSFARNINSQYGEDGIIAQALKIIGETNRWCVEFGAWDGKHLSNTHHLIRDQGYSAVLIEGDAKKFRELTANFMDRQDVVPVNRWVGFDSKDNLDSILGSTPIPSDFDVLSIDIDGNDYHVWDACLRYRPKLVVIEFNPTIPTSIDFVQEKNMQVAQGSSLLAFDRLARQKKYQLVATTLANAIFVDEQYFPQFGIVDNSPAALRCEESLVTHLFQGFDGTMFVRGCNRLVWHGVEFNDADLQQLPSWLRKHPCNLGRWGRRAINWYRQRAARRG